MILMVIGYIRRRNNYRGFSEHCHFTECHGSGSAYFNVCRSKHFMHIVDKSLNGDFSLLKSILFCFYKAKFFIKSALFIPAGISRCMDMSYSVWKCIVFYKLKSSLIECLCTKASACRQHHFFIHRYAENFPCLLFIGIKHFFRNGRADNKQLILIAV